MRRFFSLFMVVLLALRGLAGDAMAMEQNVEQAHHMGHELMQAQVQLQDEMVATVAEADHGHAEHLAHAVMLADAQAHGHHDAGPSHKAAPSGAVTCSAEAADSACHQHEGHCTACGICHSTLANPELLTLHSSLPLAAQPAHGAARFASAAPADLVKPPISAL